MAILLGGAAVAPSSASAYVGESLVESGGKLTSSAETILKNPTFITENLGEAGTFGGVAEESAAAAVFESGAMLPALGSLVAFGVGAGIGSEICGVLGIEGCWFVHSDSADPVDEVSGHWVFTSVSKGFAFAKGTGTIPAYIWYWGDPGEVPDASEWSATGTTECKLGYTPPGVSFYLTESGSGVECGIDAKMSLKRLPLRYGMENRSIDYHASDDPGIGNYEYEVPEEWSKEMASALGGSAQSDRVGEKIASKIAGSKVLDPYAAHVDVPDCDGLLWAACSDLIEELGLEPQRSEKDWEGADVGQPADAVLETSPAAGVEVSVSTKVTVVTNPDEAGMPLIIPKPETGETYSHYIARLAPGLDPERVNVGEAFTDPAVGPNAVLHVAPGSGTRLDPATDHDVEVQTNPATAPEPVTGGWTAPSIPALDLSPLTDVEIGCNDFPFGVFCWMADGLTSWGAEGECPSFAIPFVSEIRESEDDLVFDTCTFEPAMNIIRPMIVILSFFGVAWLLSASAMGLGGGASADD